MSTQDLEYNPENVDPGLRPVFDQLIKKFSPTWCVFHRRGEESGQWMSAGVKNQKTQATVIIRLSVRSGTKKRGTLLDHTDLQKIRTHMRSGKDEFVIPLP